ncbi:transcription factor E2F5 isoform X3 [Nothobranchius furzeri]|uniref:transcription factor E2F5 isoform X3 n=1 Tax=Nothobranchius furzeri TaxID=105023 RepID=UPI002403CB43|nr:transcription factor E2F5 isoform X3 [Nothobranchius furzeri]
MEVETTETLRSTPTRHEKSLGLLTMKFVCLLQETKDGVLDLKVAADSLAVKQKRRIYDITNVLEGVGLIEKKNKNVIQWRGQDRNSQTQEVLGQVKALKAQISELETQEKELDEQSAWLEENIKHLNHDPVTSAYKFVTHEDICSAFGEDTLVAIVAPSGTQLEVPLPKTQKSGQRKYQVNLRSHSAPIQVTLMSRGSDSVPVVLPLPPTDDICLMPTPPSTPASLQRLPLLNSACSTSTTTPLYCSQDSICSDHQMVLLDLDEVLTAAATSGDDEEMDCHLQPGAMLEQHQIDLTDPDLQTMLDVGNLLKLSSPGDHVEDDQEGAVDLIDELMSANGVDYSFNLDDSEGCFAVTAADAEPQSDVFHMRAQGKNDLKKKKNLI